MKAKILFSILLLVLGLGNLHAGTYATWRGPELDKYASIWLIRTFLDSEATFLFYPMGEEITKGIPFDVPEAKWKRTGSHTTFDTILKELTVNDSALTVLADLIREIEISRWAATPSPAAQKLEQDFSKAIQGAETDPERVEIAVQYFSAWYEAAKDNSRKDVR